MERSRRGPIASALLCAATLCAPAGAQDLSEREFLTEFPTVLSASRLRQNVADAPQAVTVIDQETIRASGVREIPELFRMVPGFNVSYVTHVKGHQPIVSYHGLGREFFSRLQVLIDGRSMNNATLGGVDWNDFPLALDDIERIEVIRGPSTATYGIGAFLGTINFITKHPSQQRGVFATVNAGNDGILDGVARYAAAAGNGDFRITAEHQSDNGFPNIANGRTLDFVTGRADWQLGRIDSLMFQAGVTSRSSDVGSGQPFDPVRTARFETGYAQLKWERAFDADNALGVQLYYYRFKLSDKYVTDPIFGTSARFTVDDGSTVSRADLEVQQTFSVGSSLRGVWGGGLREDLAEAPRILEQSARLRVARLFGHLEWRATDWALVNVGAMLENNSLAGTDVAPQVALNLRVARDHVIRIGASKALRNPTLFEENTQSIVIGPGGNPIVVSGGLQPETIVSTEIGYVGEWPDWHTTLDVKLFEEKLSNLIDLIGAGGGFPPSAFPRTAVNGDDVRQRGIEGQLVWRPLAHTSLAISATHLEADSADRFGSYSTSAPRNTLHVLGSHRFGENWDASLTYHQQSGYRPLGASADVSGFNRVDVRVARRFAFGSSRGEIAAVVENLFDQQYTEFRPENVAQRRAWLTLTLRL